MELLEDATCSEHLDDWTLLTGFPGSAAINQNHSSLYMVGDKYIWGMCINSSFPVLSIGLQALEICFKTPHHYLWNTLASLVISVVWFVCLAHITDSINPITKLFRLSIVSFKLQNKIPATGYQCFSKWGNISSLLHWASSGLGRTPHLVEIKFFNWFSQEDILAFLCVFLPPNFTHTPQTHFRTLKYNTIVLTGIFWVTLKFSSQILKFSQEYMQASSFLFLLWTHMFFQMCFCMCSHYSYHQRMPYQTFITVELPFDRLPARVAYY